MAIGWSLAIQRAVTVALFQLVRLLFVGVQRVYWEINGTARQVREAKDPRNYERCAQVLDIRYEHHFCETSMNKFDQFVCTHNRFENPQFVIDNEHVTLWGVEDDTAIFAVAREKSMRVWKGEFNGAIKLAQPEFCNQLIVVPLSAFHRMSETIGDPKCEVVFLAYTARCGSTLMKQIMEFTGRCVTISDPDTPNIVATRYLREGDSPELRQLARDIIRWECRPYPTMEPPPLAYVIKITAFSAAALPLFTSVYPKGRFLFMYRDVIKSSKSLYRVAYSFPAFWVTYKLGRLSARLTEFIIDTMGLYGPHYRYRFHDDMDYGVILNCVLMKAYLDQRRTGKVEVVGIRYEDLIADPAETIRRILEYCHLPVELTEAGRRGLEIDSQGNMPIAKSVIGALREPELTPETKNRANKWLKQYGCPLIGEECLLEGTLSYINRPTVK